jgi:hypothetical protein
MAKQGRATLIHCEVMAVRSGANGRNQGKLEPENSRRRAMMPALVGTLNPAGQPGATLWFLFLAE